MDGFALFSADGGLGRLLLSPCVGFWCCDALGLVKGRIELIMQMCCLVRR